MSNVSLEAQALALAADLIEVEGWTKGTAGAQYSEIGPRCVLGSIWSAACIVENDNPDQVGLYGFLPVRPLENAVQGVLGLSDDPGAPMHPLARWNDNYAEDADEVVETLRQAASSLVEEQD